MVIRKQIVLPWTDLNLEGLTRADRLKLFDDIGVVLALLAAGRPGEPQLLDTDGAGRLKVTSDGVAPAQVRIQDGLSTGLVTTVGWPTTFSPGRQLETAALLYGYNAGLTSEEILRSVNANSIGTTISQGGLLTSAPGQWTAVHTPAAGVQATATRAAGSASQRHVCTGIIVSFGAIVAPVATLLQWNLRDGVSGVGAILASGQVAIPAAVAISDTVALAGLGIYGSAATAMTLEFSAALANLAEGVTLIGYDVI